MLQVQKIHAVLVTQIKKEKIRFFLLNLYTRVVLTVYAGVNYSVT
jgi:hypothetical protein